MEFKYKDANYREIFLEVISELLIHRIYFALCHLPKREYTERLIFFAKNKWKRQSIKTTEFL